MLDAVDPWQIVIFRVSRDTCFCADVGQSKRSLVRRCSCGCHYRKPARDQHDSFIRSPLPEAASQDSCGYPCGVGGARRVACTGIAFGLKQISRHSARWGWVAYRGLRGNEVNGIG